MRRFSIQRARQKFLGFTGVLCNLAAVLVLLVAATGVLGVVMRYALGYPVAWTDKFAEYCIPLIVMLCAAEVMARDENIGIDLALRALKRRARWLFERLKEAMLLLTSLALLASGAGMVAFAKRFELYDSGDMGWPLWTLELCLPVGSALMAAALVINLLAALAARKEEG